MAEFYLERLSPEASREEIINAYNELADTLEYVLRNLDEENTTDKYEEEHRNGD